MRPARFWRAREGAASIVTALSSVALIGFAGLATDVGAVYLEARRLQGAADLAALTALRDGRGAHAAAAVIADNGWPADTRLTVTPGVYTPDRAIAPGARFAANAPGANAVHVEIASSAPLYFGRLFIADGRMPITRRATAAQTRAASFQIGSRLLSLRGGAANDLLSALAGGEVSLSVMDYQALLSADVELFSYIDALRTRLDLEAASYGRTLDRRVATPVALQALADVLLAQDARAARAVSRIADAANRAGGGSLNTLIDLGPYGAQDHAPLSGASQIHVSAMDLTSAILQIAGGDRQVRLQLGAGVPGLAATNVWLAIGERPNASPWLAVTDDDSVIVRTAQMRLYIETQVAGAGALAQVRVPVLVEMASAQARLSDISCALDGRAGSVTLAVAPAVGALRLGEVNTARLDNFTAPLDVRAAELVRTPLARVEGAARVDLGGAQWQDVRFSRADIERGAVKSVATRDIAAATMSSLLGRTDLNVRALGLGLNLGGLTASLRGVLNAAAAPLDELVNGLTDLLGVRLGEADVRVNGVRCGGAALVA